MLTMRWLCRVVIFWLPLVLATSAAYAQDLNLKKIPQDKVCVEVTGARAASDSKPVYRLKAEAFAHWLFDDYKIGWSCGASEGGPMQALAVVTPISSDRCSQTEKAALGRARNYVTDLLRSGTQSDGFEIRTGVPPSKRYASDLFDKNPRVEIRCLRAETAKKVPTLPKISETTIGGWRVKLRGDQDSLKYGPDDESYKTKAKAAQISITDDSLKGSTAYSAAITVGLDSGAKTYGSSIYRLMPYIKWERTHFDPQKKGSEVDKLAFGALGNWYYLPKDSFLLSKFSFDPQWVTDEVGASGLFAMTLKYAPSVRWGSGESFDTYPGGIREFAGLFNYQWEATAVLRVGRVLYDGGHENLSLTKNFLYYGPQIGLTLSGLEGTGWDQLKLNLSYFNLLRGEGQFERLEKFSAALTYMFTKDGNVEVTLSYESGRDYEKFDKTELWKTSLGYKF